MIVMPRSTQGSTRSRLIRGFSILASCTALAPATTITMTVGAGADANAPAPPLPMFTPTPTNWAPNFAFPQNLRQNEVTDADITSEREMCEWFNAQFDTLMDQINTFNANLATNHDDYTAPAIQQQADAVTANIDQSEDYLAPRARAFTRKTHCDGDDGCDTYIPIYKGDTFIRLWQQQSNIKNHNPSGINNISIGLTNLYANGIRGSSVRPGGHQFATAAASSASHRPALGILRLSRTGHRRPERSGSVWPLGCPALPRPPSR